MARLLFADVISTVIRHALAHHSTIMPKSLLEASNFIMIARRWKCFEF